MAPLEVVRHSLAHVMAQATLRLFPQEKIQFGVGPTIADGLYYDIKMEHKLTEDDLKNIEAEMKAIIKDNIPIVRQELSRAES